MTSASTPGGPPWQSEPAADTTGQPPTSTSFFRWVRGLDITRTPDRWVGGVAGGVARRTGLDLALVRGLIVVLAVFGGIGVLLYGLAWALLPEPDGRIHVEQAGRGSWTSGLTGAAALVAVGLWRPNFPFLGDGGGGGLLWTLFWIGAVVLFVYWIVNRSTRDGGEGRPGQPGAGPQGPASGPGFGSGPADGQPPVDPPATDRSEAGDPAPGTSTATGTPRTPSTPEEGRGLAPDPSGTVGAAPTTDVGSETSRTVPLPYQPGATLPLPGARALPYQPGPAGWTAASDWPAPGPYGTGKTSVTPRVHPKRPSGATTALVLGGATVVAAAVLALDHLGVVALSSPGVVAFAGAAVILALGIIILGIRGRSSGPIGFTAAVSIVGALIASFGVVGGTWVVAREATAKPASLATAAEGYSVLAADTTIDLTDLPPLRQELVVPVSVLAGDLTVIVPDDVPVEVRTRIALGAANADDPGAGAIVDLQADSGVLSVGSTSLNPDARGPALRLDVRGAVSDITFTTPTGDTP
ncbi:Predicted membrane protein [Arthrobacter agilis]|uniref:PspC domain-containing protein n=1 Tax=Arthrobacter agilis TaxID=37921 RepID=UPI000F6CCAC7|nr:PspC domain-containing protein [Arthrobacter agilis]VDR33048.1 Predicted membrane protein [Arthrobacter agilis]